MKITVNGDPADVADGETIDDLLAAIGTGPKGIAVAVNGEVVSRSRWSDTALAEDDRVEVLTAAQGG